MLPACLPSGDEKKCSSKNYPLLQLAIQTVWNGTSEQIDSLDRNGNKKGLPACLPANQPACIVYPPPHPPPPFSSLLKVPLHLSVHMNSSFSNWQIRPFTAALKLHTQRGWECGNKQGQRPSKKSRPGQARKLDSKRFCGCLEGR